MQREPMAMGPVFFGEIHGQRIYYSSIRPLVRAIRLGEVDVEGVYFVQMTWYAPLRPMGKFTRMVDRLSKSGIRIFMCTNSIEEFSAMKTSFPELPSACLSEHFFSTIRHDLSSKFYLPGDRSEHEREFRAILNARREKYKNRDLATTVERIALIRATGHERPDPRFVSPVFLNHRLLTHEEVNQIYGTSKMSLILSEIEGANRTTVESLLAGLPIVSVESLGGRHLLLDCGNSILLPALEDRSAMRRTVAEAVDEMEQRIRAGKIDRKLIRCRVIQRLRWYQQLFIECLKSILAPLGRVDLIEERARQALELHLGNSDSARLLLQGGKLAPRDPTPIEEWPIWTPREQ